MNAEDLFTIIITTKDRKDDLDTTLEKLLVLGLSGIRLLLIDDGSKSDCCSPALLQKFSAAQIYKNDISRGLIVNRNRLAALATTEYVVSLDDDSCFDVRPDFAELHRIFQQNSEAIALQLNNYDSRCGQTPVDRTIKPYRVQSYTGCGHILHRVDFLALRGYNESYIHMCEERDFAQRAWRNSRTVIMTPFLPVEHRRTPVARIPARNLYFLTRNTVLFNILNFPLRIAVAKILFLAPYTIAKNSRTPRYWTSILRGLAHGLSESCRQAPQRAPMTMAQYRRYISAPQMR